MVGAYHSEFFVDCKILLEAAPVSLSVEKHLDAEGLHKPCYGSQGDIDDPLRLAHTISTRYPLCGLARLIEDLRLRFAAFAHHHTQQVRERDPHAFLLALQNDFLDDHPALLEVLNEPNTCR